MKEAVLYEKKENNMVRCVACKHYCTIPKNSTGVCAIRYNKEGKLYLLTYGKTCAAHIDPIEKKPLYHFLPGTDVFSIGTFGCNFSCQFCQNWSISQTPKHEKLKNPEDQLRRITRLIDNNSDTVLPEYAVQYCKNNGIPSIAYTYNEPTVFVEYAHDTAVIAKKEGIKNVFVSSGYETEETMEYMKGLIDAANIDLKSFSDSFYRKLCKTELQKVLDTIKSIKKRNIWMEITTLIIPGKNDGKEELRQLAEFIASVDKNIPWHVTAFHPDYKMLSSPSTTPETLRKAHDIGKEAGLSYVYTGNIPGIEYENTFCPECNEVLIKRFGMRVQENNIVNSKCQKCGAKIHGIF
ncbi:AmmeMemoRadiSam system radical SAM enzyme [Candidatus Woesearchaeota archaeon]|nr:MAG: AmmeMemoRadiSam system radical SAM enzyme [Candidatus Woesearchaeota archaeon]